MDAEDDGTAGLAELWQGIKPQGKAKLDERMALACDASTPPSILRALAAAPEASIRRAVAGNPNVAPDTLMTLAAEFPDEFFANAALALLLLENPALFSEMPEETLARLMAHPSMPRGQLLESTRHRAFYVRRAAAQNPRMPPELLIELAEKQSYFEEVAGNPSTPPDYLAKLARHDWVAVRKAAAENPSLPESAVPELANDGDAKVRKAVVANAVVTDVVFTRLAEHESAIVRLAVAECARAPVAVLTKLEGDRDGAVRFAASRTKSKARRPRF